MKLSVVSTFYKSEGHLEEFYRRIKAALVGLGVAHEIVLVNDGSPDNALAIAVRLAEADGTVKVVDLSRNFGHHKAIMTGLGQASGELVFLIDSDLEEDPELVGAFLQEWRGREGQADVVYGVMGQREGGCFRRASGAAFTRLFNAVAGVTLPENFTMTRLMTRRYVEALLAYRERHVFIGGLFLLPGFVQVPLLVRRRYKGQSTYTLARRLALTGDALTSFSSRPLVYVCLFGLALVGLDFFWVLFLVYDRIFNRALLSGWTSTMVSLWFLGGAVIFCIGVVGLYVAKVFEEVKGRPYTIIRRVIHRGPGTGPNDPERPA